MYRYSVMKFCLRSSCSFLHRSLLGTVILLMPAVVVKAATVAESHHERTAQQCAACHSEPQPLKSEIKNCNRCHEMPEKALRLLNIQKPSASAKQKQPARLKKNSVVHASNQSFSPGMNMAMYYSPSRLGAQPNEMIAIPEGEFIMGSDARLEDEGPEHNVFLERYSIDRYEVTNLQYKRFIDDTGRRSPRHFRNRTYPEGKADHPVTFVSWFDAEQYCDWAGKRLPTEQEWEKAARGTKANVFPWGNEFNLDFANTPVRWAELKQEGDTTPVGAFPGGNSPYGLSDVSGNVWEWVDSWYGPHPGNTRESENYGEINRVLKGGSWWDCSFYQCGISAPTFNRSFFNPKVKNASFGFRCARGER